MTTFGVTLAGFIQKDIDDILSEVEESEREKIKQSLNLLATSVFGQVNGIIGDKLREEWDLGLAVYRSAYPASASGEALDEVSSITDTTRLGLLNSTVTLDRMYLETGTTVSIGSIVSVGAGGVQFETLAALSNAIGYSQVLSVTAQSVDTGPVVGLAGKINTIVTPESGWIAKPVTQSVTETYVLVDGYTLILEIDSGTAQTFTFDTGDFVSIGAATAAEVVAVIDATLIGGTVQVVNSKVWIESDTLSTGSIQVTGGTGNGVLGFPITLIEGMNSLDAVVGRNVESDEALRVRRKLLLRAIGKGSVEAIRAALLDNTITPGVSKAFVFENVKKVTVDGIPASAIECVVVGGTNQDIADTIFAYRGSGIEPYGNTVATATDSMGVSHQSNFSRVVDVDYYIDLSITTTSPTYPIDGDDQVKAALAAFGDALDIGEDIIALQFKSVPLDVPGVGDVTSFKIDTVFPPVNTANKTVVFRNQAVFDTSRIRIL